MNRQPAIAQYLKVLRLPAIARNLEATLREAEQTGRSHEEFLCALLEQEIQSRMDSCVKTRMKQAGFPKVYLLENFDFTAIPTLNPHKVMTLSRGEYITRRENILLMGTPGTGKTFLSIALAVCACRQGRRVKFYSAHSWATELEEAHNEHRLSRLEKQWQKYDLVVLDDIGFLPFTPVRAQIMYQFCASRYERGSLIVSSNLEFSQWHQVFGDEALTAVLVDRLTHHAHVLSVNGESYRFREALARQTNDPYGGVPLSTKNNQPSVEVPTPPASPSETLA